MSDENSVGIRHHQRGTGGHTGERHCGHCKKPDGAPEWHWLMLGGTGGTGTGEGFWDVLGALRVLRELRGTEGDFVSS